MRKTKQQTHWLSSTDAFNGWTLTICVHWLLSCCHELKRQSLASVHLNKTICSLMCHYSFIFVKLTWEAFRFFLVCMYVNLNDHLTVHSLYTNHIKDYLMKINTRHMTNVMYNQLTMIYDKSISKDIVIVWYTYKK
jgi:hypothetical protein